MNVCTRTSQAVPLTPLRRPGDRAKDTTAVPFLSTPVSVKKARLCTDVFVVYVQVCCYSTFCYYRTNSITFASNQKTARTPLTVHTPHVTETTPFASFQAHMLSFRDRFASMLDQSSASNALDVSNIYTPVSCCYCTFCSCEYFVAL